MVLDAQTGEADVRVPLDALVTVKPENATTDLRVLRDEETIVQAREAAVRADEAMADLLAEEDRAREASEAASAKKAAKKKPAQLAIITSLLSKAFCYFPARWR